MLPCGTAGCAPKQKGVDSDAGSCSQYRCFAHGSVREVHKALRSQKSMKLLTRCNQVSNGGKQRCASRSSRQRTVALSNAV